MNNQDLIQVRFTSNFKKNLTILAKKYRQIRYDIEPTINEIRKGNFLGDQIPRTNYTVLKVRIKNSNIKKGKSSGYRLIYQVKTPTNIILVTIYSKLDQADIKVKEINKIIQEFENN